MEDLDREQNRSKALQSSKCMACLKKSQICFISSDRDSGWREKPAARDIMCVDFSRACSQASRDIAVDKMEKYRLSDSTMSGLRAAR